MRQPTQPNKGYCVQQTTSHPWASDMLRYLAQRGSPGGRQVAVPKRLRGVPAPLGGAWAGIIAADQVA